jgi:hypothetical protein
MPKENVCVKKNPIIIDDKIIANHPHPFEYQVIKAMTAVSKVMIPHVIIYSFGKKPDMNMVYLFALLVMFTITGELLEKNVDINGDVL